MSELTEHIKHTLPQERWFVTKSKNIVDVNITDSLRVDISGLTFVICFADVKFESTSDTYLLYFTESERGGIHTYENALNSTVFVNYLYNIFRQSAEQKTERGAILGENMDPGNNSFPKFSSIKLHSGEQSNSTVFLGRDRIMKVYRRKTDYHTPDYQIPRAFHQDTEFKGTPECYGSIYYSSGDDTSLIATVSKFVENQGDCWQYFTGKLASEAETGEIKPDLLAEEIRSLGKLTAEMHNALSSLKGENFFPVPLTIDDLSSWLTEVTNNAMLLTEYRNEHTGIPGYDDIMNHAKGILAKLSKSEMSKIRIHGDFHLGQILKSGDDYYVIDFEGEPMRSLEYRRLRQTPAKDIAGMVRSIHYAAAFCTINNPDPVLRESAKKWAKDLSALYVSAYLDGVDRKAHYIPENDEDFNNLLEFFILDKALYEFNYEVNNRPSWVRIPLEAITGIIRTRD